MRLIAVLGVLLALASCSDSDMEFKCGGYNEIYHMTLSADKSTLTITRSYGVSTLYYAWGGKDELGGFRTYKDFDGGAITFRTDTESFLGCERIK